MEDQARTISALEVHLARLERRERRRRSSGSLSSDPSNRSRSSLGSPVRGNVWTGVGTSGNPYEVQEVEIRSLEPEDDEVPVPVPPPPPRGGFSQYEGMDAALHDPEEILQVNPDENSLPVPLRRLPALTVDDEGWIVCRDEVPPYEAPPEYS